VEPANPLLSGNGSGNGYSVIDGENEMAATDTTHVPTAMAGFLMLGVGLLILLDKGDFKFVVAGNVGRG
jgi:hypothetical protein